MKAKRELGFFDALMMGLGGAIGFEIFVLLDYPYLNLELGASIVLSLLLAGLVNFLIILNYCELSAAIPKIGGAYTYIKTAYGGLTPFIFGCFRWLASIFGAALAAVVFTEQLSYLLRVSPTLQSFVSAYTPLIALIVIIAMAVLGIRGKKGVGVTIVFVFVAMFAIFIGGGLLHELAPVEAFPKSLPNDILKILAATVYMFPMFFGVRALVAGASRVKNPKKNLPKAMLLSSLLIIPLYVCVAYVSVGIVPLEKARQMQEEAGWQIPLLNLAAQEIFGWAGGVLVSISGIVASLSALSTSLTVQSSILRGMSRDAYLPKFLFAVHRRFGTPHAAIIAGSLFIMLFSFTGAVAFLGYAASFGSLIVFAAVNFALLKIRQKKPYMERPFKTPLYPFTPIAGIITSVALLVFPMLLMDANASFALLSSIGLTSLVLMTYYIRMMGRNRLQIAVGGAGLGIGVSMALLTFLTETGLMAPFFPNIPSYIKALVTAVSIVSGILNSTTHG